MTCDERILSCEYCTQQIKIKEKPDHNCVTYMVQMMQQMKEQFDPFK